MVCLLCHPCPQLEFSMGFHRWIITWFCLPLHSEGHFCQHGDSGRNDRNGARKRSSGASKPKNFERKTQTSCEGPANERHRPLGKAKERHRPLVTSDFRKN